MAVQAGGASCLTRLHVDDHRRIPPYRDLDQTAQRGGFGRILRLARLYTL